ncbi:hypothetical protein OI70_18980 [Dickeya fangzhongdai]|uniref:TIGR03749 family integrating conjugative element protein n=1 Tax=Dickeya fangzhongdai TaxID=1778540 RepID=UPI000575BB7F|nr:TIGR03749 family integrating conjugative element protein [Dickeya fangzhongdai]KHN52886.1 hypothetical protein OI70_18980 [Dickeya fangzhongdai]
MKYPLLIWLGELLFITLTPTVHAVEIQRWERLPLAVPLVVGQERIVFIDRNVRVGVPASISDHLRVQSAGGAVYLRASKPIEPTRLQLQDADTGALILLDIAARSAKNNEPPLEPVRIVEGENAAQHYGQQQADTSMRVDSDNTLPLRHETPVPVILTRFAAQNLYTPLRTVEAVPGITRVNLPRHLDLTTLLPAEPVIASALAAWRLEDQWVTAIQLTNTTSQWLTLDPRALQGDFLTATFQHATLGPHATPEDTTVVYLVTRGEGLAHALLPAIHRIDPSVNLSNTTHSSSKEINHGQ